LLGSNKKNRKYYGDPIVFTKEVIHTGVSDAK
jgi:hypothetical protein